MKRSNIRPDFRKLFGHKGIRLSMIAAGALIIGCYDRSLTMGTERVADKVTVKTRTVNYSDQTVPEESGSRFVKFSDETDYVVGPDIRHDHGIIVWYTGSFLDVSPDGKSIAYIGKKNEKTNIFIKSTVGGKATVQRTFRNNVFGVCYSPNGSQLAFSESLDSDFNIYQQAADKGVAVQTVAATTSFEASPCYASDNSTIYFTKGEKDATTYTWRFYIWSFNTKTALATQYTEGYSCDLSKNGKILYLTRTNKETLNGEIWSIDLDSGQETLILADENMGFSTPQISPDGKKLLCVGSTSITKERNENLDLYVVDVDGSNLTQLTFHPGDDCSPCWDPKGEKIYFLGQRGNEKGNFGLWMIEYQK